MLPRPSRAWIKLKADQRPKRNRDDENDDDHADHGVIPGQGQQIEGNVLAEDRVAGAGRGRTEETQERHPKRRRAEGDDGGKNEGRKPWRALRHRRQWPAQDAASCSRRRCRQNKDGDENPRAKPERQPIAVALAEFLEPVVLQRYRQRCLETDDAENGSRDVGEVAIKAVQERDRRTAACLVQEGAAERKGGEKDRERDSRTGTSHSLSEDRRNSAA